MMNKDNERGRIHSPQRATEPPAPGGVPTPPSKPYGIRPELTPKQREASNGFTALQASSIRRLARHAQLTAIEVGPMHALWDSIYAAREAAAHIEALLPPEE